MARNPDDVMRSVLAIVITVAFFCFLGLLIVKGVPKSNAAIAFQLLGTLTTAFGLVFSYYFKRKH